MTYLLPPLDGKADSHAATHQGAVREIIAVAHELMGDEPGLDESDAIIHAAAMLDDLDVYAAEWNCAAYVAGNPHAMTF